MIKTMKIFKELKKLFTANSCCEKCKLAENEKLMNSLYPFGGLRDCEKCYETNLNKK